MTFDLLRRFGIPYTSRGKGGRGIIRKLLYIIQADLILIRVGMRFKPDIFLSFASTYAAHASFILRRPHIAFDDTEHSKYEIFLYRPFTTVILNPQYFKKNFGKKQIRFRGFMELCYLHPNYYTPDSNVLSELGIKETEPFILLRFVSWTASHDLGEKGFSLETKIYLVKALSEYVKVFISSENELPVGLVEYKLPVSPEKLHDVLFYATLYLGEGATTASECAMLGTPAIYVNPLSTGTLEEQERMGLIHSFRNPNGVVEKALELLTIPNIKTKYRHRRDTLLGGTIDVTAFMVWFVENFPSSIDTMIRTPEYQNIFQ